MPSRSLKRWRNNTLHLRLVIAYDGTRYAGWQRQQNAPTIQAMLEAAVHRVTRQRVVVTGAGRTDAGVHARAQVAHARVRTRLSPTILQRALNAVLPPDILIRRLTEAPRDFHARFHAVKKWYRYRIVTGRQRPLFERAYVHHVPQPLNLTRMRRAARRWIGRHDFRAFHSTGRPVASTRRTVHRLRVTSRGREIHVDVVADGFLYHMVRRMVGALLKIGRGDWPVCAARALIHQRDMASRIPRVIAPTAPAQGLCLMRVTYPT